MTLRITWEGLHQSGEILGDDRHLSRGLHLRDYFSDQRILYVSYPTSETDDRHNARSVSLEMSYEFVGCLEQIAYYYLVFVVLKASMAFYLVKLAWKE